jgi:predicted metalloprotease
MKWQDRARSAHVEDRRAQGGGGLGPLGGGPGGFRIPIGRRTGGLGIVGTIVVLGLVWLLSGQNPIDVLNGGGTTPASWAPPQGANQDQLAGFVSVVTKDTEDLWTKVFAANSQTYDPPTLVLFTGATASSCGDAQASAGPFYCPVDRKVYVDLGFYDQLRQQFGAPGDFAEAYVIAHEVGHHVQNLLGVLPEFTARRPAMSPSEANAYSVRVELQADCYAGVWANFAQKMNYLDTGDTEEAINAANAIGDDTLTGGQVAPRNFTHGTAEQRMHWLKVGLSTGDIRACDTFVGSV